MKKFSSKFLAIAYMVVTASAAMAQTDATKYIQNPSFEKDGFTGWTVSGLVMQSNTSFIKSGTVYAEKWVIKGTAVGNASITQVINGLPFGKYTLTVTAQNLDQNNTTGKCYGAYIFAGDKTNRTTVYTPADYSVDFDNTTGTVKLGFIASGATGNWLAVDNFRLTLVEATPMETVLSNLGERIAVAERLAGQKIDSKAQQQLVDALQKAKAITAESATKDVMAAFTDINAAIENGEFAVKLANATHGTGTAIKVTSTNHYCPTGATEALMRFETAGSNVLERGVCWSTEHNPTVLDSRTNEYWTLNGNIYHITGLKSATVYYLRPYVMNNTYEVAYGDEVKIVTHPKGTCIGTWNEGAPTLEANIRCRNAIRETIEYFNEWTGIAGFRLTGSYGAQTPTADCSYGGWMRIGPNAGNQAIGTVIHETGHGVGVGTSARYADANVHSWKWFGREANKVYSFLENIEANPYDETEEYNCMVGDGTHAWGRKATYDWFVNGADKDKHLQLQYAGGCILLYGMFVDGMNPTTGYTNGLPAYTYNFDEGKKYYIMCKNEALGLGTGLMTARTARLLRWKEVLGSKVFLTDNDAWNLEYDAQKGYYRFRNVGVDKYLSHSSGATAVNIREVTSTMPLEDSEEFQLMPDRTDVTLSNGYKTHGYWVTWKDNGNKSMTAGKLSSGYGLMNIENFDFADTATRQQFIIIAEDELVNYRLANGFLLGDVNLDGKVDLVDAKLITDYYLGKNPASFAKELADVNCDGKVTEADANIIVNQAIK